LPDGRQRAGSDLKAGDKILIYQCKWGRTVLSRAADGSPIRRGSTRGNEGIIAVTEAEDIVLEVPDIKPTRYSDGTEIWWKWRAPLKILSRSGFVPRIEVNSALGYKESYPLRGFGDLQSGLKKIDQEKYEALVEIFRKNSGKKLPDPSPIIRATSKKSGTGVESKEHRLLKEYVASAPASVLEETGLRTLKIEYGFITGDRADIVMEDEIGRIIATEVKVSVSDDQFEGILQAIKYRFMLEFMTDRNPGESRAFLIAYNISPSVIERCERYSVECHAIDKDEVDKWAKKRK
jgi:hypothetical protein